MTEGRGDGGRRPAQRVLDLADVHARVRRPGQPGCREREETCRHPQSHGPVPRQCSLASLRAPARHEQLAQPLPAARRREPQGEPAQYFDPQPARCDLAVVAAEFAEVQGAVQAVEPGPHGQPLAEGAQCAAHLRVVRIDEGGLCVAVGQSLDVEGDPGHVAVARALGDGDELPAGYRLAGGFHLNCERFRLAVRGDLQLVAVDDGLDLWGRRVEQSGHGGDEQERADEDARVEVQAQQEGPQPAPGAAAVPRRGRGEVLGRGGLLGLVLPERWWRGRRGLGHRLFLMRGPVGTVRCTYRSRSERGVSSRTHGVI